MAQSDQRSKHSRHPSRILRLVTPGIDNHIGNEGSRQLRSEDEATIQYIKRVLCVSPAQPGSPESISNNEVDSKTLEELLPPLTSSNDVDIQLYAIIAIILNQFVQSWYNRITPNHDFTAEILQMIAHCTRGIEQRLRYVDLEELLLDEIPLVLIAHVDGMD